ncbi:MAG: hypothetical protein IJF00_04840, partial [Bacteroidaceae bacterium]|nr:hypothetical protein [Bacteroidaceae bacterium]
ASSRIVGQGDIVGRSGYFSLNLSANSVMRGRLDARRTLKSLVADLRSYYNGAGMPMRNFNHTLRRIIDKRHLGDGEHWIRFRNISEVANTEFFNFDYIELVPLNIVNDPTKPEDRH